VHTTGVYKNKNPQNYSFLKKRYFLMSVHVSEIKVPEAAHIRARDEMAVVRILSWFGNLVMADSRQDTPWFLAKSTGKESETKASMKNLNPESYFKTKHQ
jgi:hypothetical protein